MSTRRRLQAALLVSLLATPLTAAADARIAWSAPAECPGRAEAVAEVARLARADLRAFPSDLSASVEITRSSAEALSARVAVRAGGRTREHVLRDASCVALARAAALVIALAFEPAAGTTGRARKAHNAPAAQGRGARSTEPLGAANRDAEQTPSTQHRQTPNLQPQQTPSIQPERTPSTQPQQTPSTQPQTPSTQPQQTPSPRPQQTSSAQPQQTPSIQPQRTQTTQPQQTPSVEPARTPGLQPAQTPSIRPQRTQTTQPQQQTPSAQPQQQTPSTQPQRTQTTQPQQQTPSAQPQQQTPSAQPQQQTPSLQPAQTPSLQPAQTPSTQPQRPAELAAAQAPELAEQVAPTHPSAEAPAASLETSEAGAPSPPLETFVGAAIGLMQGTLPKLAPCGVLSVGLMSHAFYAALRLGYAPSQSAWVVAPEGTGGRVSLATAALEGGLRLHASPIELPLLAGVEAGLFIARGFGPMTRAETRAVDWLASYVSTGLAITWAECWRLGLRLDGLLALRRPSFALDTDASARLVLHRPRSFALRSYLALELYWP